MPSQDALQQRSQFKTLLLSNPNHFGNLQNSPFPVVVSIQSDTTFEAITCVGYNAETHRLEATVQLRESSGYLGGLCSAGSSEFVRFYVSSDGGATWTDAGMAAFTARDVARPGSIMHAVGVPFDAGVVLCSSPKSAFLVRAILSWNNAPPAGTPTFHPVWGNVVDVTARKAPLKLVLPLGANLASIVAKTPPSAVHAAIEAPSAESPTALAALYQARVPQQRYLYPTIHAALAKAPAAASALAKDLESVVAKENIADLIKVVVAQQGNATYERLDCVGYEAAEGMLAAVFVVRLTSGYSGGACSAGSLENVAFFVDWHDGAGFTFVGATAVRVYDYADAPSGGVRYEVRVPIDVASHQKPCSNGPVFARVRAILSWSTPVPSTDPNYAPAWGNHVDADVQIEPGASIPGGPVVPILSAVGDIPIDMIDTHPSGTGTGRIKVGGTAIHTGARFDDGPFGGQITLAGKLVNGTSASRYRIMRSVAGSPYTPLTNEPAGITLTVVTYDPTLGVHVQQKVIHADPAGYYRYEDYSSSHYVESNILGMWFSNAAEDALVFNVRIDVDVDGNPAHDAHSDPIQVCVDNRKPTVHLTIDNGVDGECADYVKGQPATGTFTATDSNIQGYDFTIEPSGPANGAHAVPQATPGGTTLQQVHPALHDPGVPAGYYTIDTSPMKPCGFALRLSVRDRTNVNSGFTNNYDERWVGFCVREAPAK